MSDQSPLLTSLLTLEELAKEWRVSEKTIKRMIWRGDLKAKRVGKFVRVPVAEAMRYLESLPAA